MARPSYVETTDSLAAHSAVIAFQIFKLDIDQTEPDIPWEILLILHLCSQTMNSILYEQFHSDRSDS